MRLTRADKFISLLITDSSDLNICVSQCVWRPSCFAVFVFAIVWLATFMSIVVFNMICVCILFLGPLLLFYDMIQWPIFPLALLKWPESGGGNFSLCCMHVCLLGRGNGDPGV